MDNETDLLFPDDEDWSAEDLANFIDDDANEQVIDQIKDIRKAVGSSLRPLFTDLGIINQRGQGAQIRGIRFTTPADALLWLFHRGIFLFSNIVNMGDGTFGVRIGSSDEEIVDNGSEEEGSDIIF